MINRWAAAGSAVVGSFGAVGLATAVAGSAPWRYVSESGVPGAPHAPLYQVSLVLLACSLALLAVATRPVCGLIALSLALSSPLAALSGVVHCSPGCPLPPYESTTPQDLVHAAAAIGALLLCALAILLYWFRVRWIAWLGMLIAWPPLILSAVGVVFVGRSLFTGVMERAALVGVSAWVVVAAVRHAWVREPQ
ncbi:DUF998 domain-containing protein [Dactylosporangium matsuzakiense]|uniref:DUF998 domain-containing protein n=1 Tax=Dactylosporangium matsuzakiense TaxID=53360 RepID=A0A9W6KEI7_9ACTN|nr:DUF998 domain-containing protein [Dactylosporangium matsuzakiense]UWZ44404.1 DUF998 domain-containing protein [Dactylosporangium matsuzakiense]GLK99436.1 hypothetical protein GCM10017581_011770 [Dactylosporangium matsuzakiense]